MWHKIIFTKILNNVYEKIIIKKKIKLCLFGSADMMVILAGPMAIQTRT